MEKEKRAGIHKNRVEMCDAVIEKYFNSVLVNMRMRAIAFAPLFHPILFFIKSILGKSNRTVRMAEQFQRHFFSPNLRLEDLPSFPKILINTTSNTTGKRVVFYKQDASAFDSQLSTGDNSKLLLAKVTGASAAVPGLFPPVPIANDLLADGGVIDNQGLESLFDYFKLNKDLSSVRVDARSPIQEGDKIVIICSDASGQIEVEDNPKKTGAASALRSTSILQATNRQKVLRLLKQYLQVKESPLTEFAFLYLSKNLKNWEGHEIGGKKYGKIKERLRSEFITPVSRIRTDLDEFDLLESFTLMYHGYTLINWIIDAHCPTLKKKYNLNEKIHQFDGWTPAFLTEENLAGVQKTGTGDMSPQQKREFIVKRLDIGSSLIFRDIRKDPKTFAPFLIASFLPFIVVLFSPLKKYIFYSEVPYNIGHFIAEAMIRETSYVLPYVWKLFEEGARYASVPVFLSDLIVLLLPIYPALFIYWMIKRFLVKKLYARDFKKVSPKGTKVPFL